MMKPWDTFIRQSTNNLGRVGFEKQKQDILESDPMYRQASLSGKKQMRENFYAGKPLGTYTGNVADRFNAKIGNY